MKNYNEAIEDCNQCLSLEPKNIKAMLRKAEALIGNKQTNEAYRQFSSVLQFDPNNVVALKAMQNMPIR